MIYQIWLLAQMLECTILKLADKMIPSGVF